MRKLTVVVILSVLLGALPSAGASSGDLEVGETTVFAEVPEPGFGEGIAMVGNTVFVGTFYGVVPNAGGPPAKVFLYDRRTGALTGEITVEEDTSVNHGLIGMTTDGYGRVYAGSEQHGVLRFTRRGSSWQQEVYAALPNLPSCLASGPPCSPTRDDRAPLANDMAFDRRGNLYVTDSWQATIWKVAPGGGEPEVWFQDDRHDFLFGLNGIALSPDGRSIYFTTTGPDAIPVEATGRSIGIYKLPLVDEPASEDVETFHTFGAGDSGDGIAFGRSGKLYVSSISSSTMIVLDPEGEEVIRWPDPVENLNSDTPYDFNSTFVFNDANRSLLIVNHVFVTGDLMEDRNLILEAFVDDTALPEARPRFP